MIDLMTFIFLNVLGVMSPGPDFAIVTQYGLTGSRKCALLATLGIAAALVIHVLYCVSGVALFLSTSPSIMRVIKILGALYLGYMGYKIWQSRNSMEETTQKKVNKNAFVDGFVTNLLNPKATVFLLSLFSLFANAMDTWSMTFAFAISIPLIAMIWFSFLSYFLTHPLFLPFLQLNRKKFMIIMSIMLIFLSATGITSALLEYQ